MIDPVIFSTEIFGVPITLRWYGVIVMIGVVIGALVVERGLRQRGENGDRIWDALIWVLPAGIIGARLWYVFNAVLGGNRSYLDNPASIIRVWEGGLHIFGGFLFGSIALLYYLRQNKLDPWLFLDAAGPAVRVAPVTDWAPPAWSGLGALGAIPLWTIVTASVLAARSRG